MNLVSDGPCSLPLQGVAELIAACPTFQAKVGSGTQIGALASVQVGKVDFTNPPARLYHWAIVTDDDLCSWEIDRFYKSAGQVVVTFQFRSASTMDPDSPEALIDYTNAVGNILVEMFELSNTPYPDHSKQFWNAVKATRLIAPDLVDQRQSEQDNEPGELYFESAFIIDWV